MAELEIITGWQQWVHEDLRRIPMTFHRNGVITFSRVKPVDIPGWRESSYQTIVVLGPSTAAFDAARLDQSDELDHG